MAALFHSHCKLQQDPLQFESENSQVFFDDSNEYLILYKEGTFIISSLRDRSIPPQTVDFVRKGAVLDARFSLDRRYLGILRSHTDIDVIDLRDGSEVSYSCKGKAQGNMVHGFVWVNNPVCDLAIVTVAGLELLKLSAKGESLKLVKHEKRAIHWFIWNHSTRLMMLCSGKDYSCIQCFQFLPDRLMKIPDFDPEVASGPGGKRARLEKSHFVAARLYDKLCCIYIFAARQELIVYQLGKEAVGKLCTINLFSAVDAYAISVLDNLLVVHNIDSRITMIFDVWLQQWSNHPIAAPLPLGGPRQGSDGQDQGGSQDIADSFIADWNFEQPNYILDKKNGKMWGLEVDLEHLSFSCSDKVNLIRCLLKRKSRDARELILGAVKSCILEREALYSVFQIFSIIIDAFINNPAKQGNSRTGKWWFYDPTDDPDVESFQLASSSDVTPSKPIDQSDIHRQVFLPIHESNSVDLDYFIPVTTEYLRGLSAHGLMAEPFLVDFVLKLIVSSQPPRFNVLHQLLQYHVIQDSMAVATHLLQLEKQYAPALQLALDMLHRLRAYQKVAEVMVSRGQLLPAMKYMKENSGLIKVQASALLDAAVRTGDKDTFFVAFRFVQQYHQQLYANNRRPTASFVSEDQCDAHVAKFRELFGASGDAAETHTSRP